MRPAHERLDWRNIEPEPFVRNVSNKLSARFSRRIEELPPRRIRTKMRFILRRQKRRLVMVEPPRQSFRRRIFEIDNRVLFGVKHVEVKQIAGTMQQSSVVDLCVGIDPFFVEPRERCGRRYSVEAMTVIKDAKFHAGQVSHRSVRSCFLCGRSLNFQCDELVDFLFDQLTVNDPRLFGELIRSEEHTSELQSLAYLVCRLLL